MFVFSVNHQTSLKFKQFAMTQVTYLNLGKMFKPISNVFQICKNNFQALRYFIQLEHQDF